MNQPKGTLLYCCLAVLIVAVWGSTFSATKILIQNGMSPIGIFFIRFFMSYFFLLVVSLHQIRANSWKDEGILALSGVLGGTLYYWLQNTALTMSQTTNVSFLLSFCPLITIVLATLFFKDQHITRNILVGLVIALFGVGFVIFSGQHELHLSPKGDILALLAAVSWAFYSQLIRPLTSRYSSIFMSRKAFFYGWVTAFFLFLQGDWRMDLGLLQRVDVLTNILYLTMFASVFCYLAWNKIIQKLGPVRCASFLYLDPFFSTIFSFIFMDEVMTPSLATGLVLIFSGVFVAQNNFFQKRNA